MTLKPFPQTQIARMEELRGLHLDALDETLDDLDDELRRSARVAIRKIKKSGYQRSVVLLETNRVTRLANDATAQHVAESIRDAAFMADRSIELIRAWEFAGRIKELPVDAEGKPLLVTDSQLARARAFSSQGLVVDAEAAFAREKRARLRTAAEQREAYRKYGARSGYRPRYTPKTEGVEILTADRKAGQIKSSREIGLSRRLHGAAADNTRTTRRAISRSLREADNMNKAGRDLVRAMRKPGVSELGQNQALTKPLRRLQSAGRRLTALGASGDATARREARREFNAAFARIKREAQKRIDRRGGYAELIQIVEKRGVVGVNRALSRWLDEKQRFNAERITETETQAAYRAREYEQVSKLRYVTHFIWHLNRASRRKYVRRTKPRPIRRKGKKGGKKTRRCVCETYDGQKFPIEVAKDYPRGGHPFCRCWYEYIFNTGKSFRREVSQQDLEWFDGLPD